MEKELKAEVIITLQGREDESDKELLKIRWCIRRFVVLFSRSSVWVYSKEKRDY